MKNRFLLLLSSICVLLLASCVKEPQPIKVTGITLNPASLSLVEGETADLVATISPKDADNKTVIWSSSNGSVASVNNGKVNALKAGSTTITAKSDDGGFTASCAVTVVAKTIEVTSISLSKTELTLTEGDSETITATVKPDDATDKTVSWSSSDPAVATVDGGKITAVKEGTATITAKAGDKTAACEVTVKKKTVAVESVELDKTELELTEGDSATLVATVKPDNATDKTVTWSTSDASVATVADGLVSAVSSGTAIITATAGEKEAACTVTVREHHYSISEIGQLEDGTIILSAPLLVVAKATLGFMVSDETGNLYVHGQVGSKQVDIGDKVQFRAKKATYRDLPELTNLYDLVKLSTSNTINYPTPIEIPDVEQISLSEAPFNTFTYCKAKGVLTGINAQSSGISYSITPFGSLARSYFLYLFYPYDYQADSDYYKSIESLIGNGVVVEYEGYFLGLNTSNGALNFLPTSIKTLITAVSSITLDKTNAHLKVGEAVTLTATVKPENATDKTVIWGSSDASVATVKDGVVTAIKEGVATITASAGDKTASCQVNVSKKIIPVESITLNKSKLSLIEGDSETLTASVKPDDATDKSVTWSSSNTSVATVSSSGLVTAKAAGTATITVRANDGGKKATCQVIVSQSGSPEAVDLGLPSGIKWATCNLGASKPEEYGDYYAWGETEPYYEPGYAQSASPVWKPGKETGYNDQSYKWSKNSFLFTKYCTKESNGYNGFVDGKTVLDSEDDAAHVILGGNWRMPTEDEWAELRTECSRTLTTQNGVEGLKVTGPNGNSIFLPSAGYRSSKDPLGTGGAYWSSSLMSQYPFSAWYFQVTSKGNTYLIYDFRSNGLSIRPVYDD